MNNPNGIQTLGAKTQSKLIIQKESYPEVNFGRAPRTLRIAMNDKRIQMVERSDNRWRLPRTLKNKKKNKEK